MAINPPWHTRRAQRTPRPHRLSQRLTAPIQRRTSLPARVAPVLALAAMLHGSSRHRRCMAAHHHRSRHILRRRRKRKRSSRSISKAWVTSSSGTTRRTLLMTTRQHHVSDTR